MAASAQEEAGVWALPGRRMSVCRCRPGLEERNFRGDRELRSRCYCGGDGGILAGASGAPPRQQRVWPGPRGGPDPDSARPGAAVPRSPRHPPPSPVLPRSCCGLSQKEINKGGESSPVTESVLSRMRLGGMTVHLAPRNRVRSQQVRSECKRVAFGAQLERVPDGAVIPQVSLWIHVLLPSIHFLY